MKLMSFLTALALTAALCPAQTPSLSLSAGYSNLHFSNSASYLHYNRDGSYAEGELSLILPSQPRLLLGVAVGASYHYNLDDYHYNDYYGNRYTVYDTTSSVGLYSLEARIGLPITSRRWRGPYLLPRLGAGLLVTDYSIDTPDFTEYHTGAAFALRPSLQAGYSWGHASAGVEISYLAAWGNFGHLGTRAQEVRAGAFLRFRF
jgi:hypothetical protein